MEAKRIQLKTFLAAIFSVLALEIAISAVNIPGSFKIAAVGGLRLVDILLLISVVLFMEKTPLAVGISLKGLPRGVARGCLWSAAFALAAFLGGGTLFLLGHNPLHLIRTQLPGTPGALFLFFLVAGVIGPVAEEIFFRGIVFGYFRRRGFWFALFFSTLLFAFLHTGPSGIPLPQLVGGAVFAAAFEVEKNLFTPMAIHILGNLAIFYLSLL